ncbi:hypothetical protein BCR34DRAFT_606287 [Clohesyomyces aquaticus]|uniref:Uncharacterized protein n=1 Tax=Clohesyomyces aquaticus TaxID=1231657 RepID=A0A1Y1YQS6_9PLEO|nr:hypothetical protein BCR34DRAFT_606287 [Clohesyomyces aquaticus]
MQPAHLPSANTYSSPWSRRTSHTLRRFTPAHITLLQGANNGSLPEPWDLDPVPPYQPHHQHEPGSNHPPALLAMYTQAEITSETRVLYRADRFEDHGGVPRERTEILPLWTEIPASPPEYAEVDEWRERRALSWVEGVSENDSAARDYLREQRWRERCRQRHTFTQGLERTLGWDAYSPTGHRTLPFRPRTPRRSPTPGTPLLVTTMAPPAYNRGRRGAISGRSINPTRPPAPSSSLPRPSPSSTIRESEPSGAMFEDDNNLYSDY